MATFESDAPPPPASRNSGAVSWRWGEEELRELADALRKQGWAAISAETKKDAKNIAASLGNSLMRRKDIWTARNGEGLARYLSTRTATNGSKCYGYIVVDQFFVGAGENGGPRTHLRRRDARDD